MAIISTKIWKSNEFYLLFLGSLCCVAIGICRYALGETGINLIGLVALVILGFCLHFYLRKKCDRTGYRLALIGAMFIILAYLAWPNRLEWPSWHDQGYYLEMMAELSKGYLTASSFRYGIGYPILAVPFYFMIGNDALFIPNLVAFAGTIYLAYLIFRSLTTELVAKVSTLLVMFATTLPYHYVIWWNHGITILCLMILTYIAINPLSNKKLLLAGMVTGYAFFTRYLDVLVFLPILLYIFKRSKTKGTVLTIFGAAPFICLTTLAHWLVFGDSFMTPYRTGVGTTLDVFSIGNVPINIFLTFLYFPKNMAESTVGLGMPKVTVLVGVFYLIFAPLGAYLLHKTTVKKEVVITMVASAIICILYSSAYYQFHSGTFGFFPSDFRYLLLAYPYLVLFSVVGLFSMLDMDKYERQGKKDENR